MVCSGSFIKKVFLFILCILIITLFFSPNAFSSHGEEMNLLLMYYGQDELVVTPARRPRPVSRTAENITIITSEDIGLMNAHTLMDVLKSVPGIQLDIRDGLGTYGTGGILGTPHPHRSRRE